MQILGLFCSSFASVGLAEALESVIFTCLHGNFCDNPAPNWGGGADIWLSWGEVRASRDVSTQELCAGWPGAVWELLMGALHLSGSRLHFQPLVQCLTHSQDSAVICRP